MNEKSHWRTPQSVQKEGATRELAADVEHFIRIDRESLRREVTLLLERSKKPAERDLEEVFESRGYARALRKVLELLA